MNTKFATFIVLAASAGGAVHTHPAAEPELPCAQSGSVGSEGASLAGERLEDLIRAGLAKSPERAVEKALVCYEGDASRVVDLCRARLVVEGLPQRGRALLGFLRFVARSASVQTVLTDPLLTDC